MAHLLRVKLSFNSKRFHGISTLVPATPKPQTSCEARQLRHEVDSTSMGSNTRRLGWELSGPCHILTGASARNSE
ncbi:hypothetical protein KC19_12G116100 [Ceratodon purpureus]|uniref:Uncharacterized protein n=1 Tax=Ceratodon purpureus TaxID=3225 RepID=A0A8T0GA91_CERPU|nr:hypothetical protein KC19_12G116100 [Ceratodon purpureus]